jgi:hypothetical protein
MWPPATNNPSVGEERVAGAKDVVTRACEVTRSCKGADALIRGIPGSWIRNDARRGYALVAVPDHHLTREQCMRMDWKIREIVKGLPKSYHRWLLGTPGRAPKHTPITTATQ